jgi:hypothetical protein
VDASPLGTIYGLGVRADRNKDLLEVHNGVVQILTALETGTDVWRQSPDRATVRELIASMLLDLDSISARAEVGRYPLPAFATDFISRRLARKLAARYTGRDLGTEFDRRFAAAHRAAVERRNGEWLRPAIDRLRLSLNELRAVLRLTDQLL